jgi:hypothetical protein
MKPHFSDKALQLLRDRDGIRTDVMLADGRTAAVWNIAWGRDIGDDYDHVTTNVSPAPPAEHQVDFFYTHEIAAIVDPESGIALLDSGRD